MKALLINAKTQTIDHVEYDGCLKTVYDLVECTYVSSITITDEIHVMVDEEGCTKSYGFGINGKRFYGNGLVIQINEGGETVDYTAPDAYAVQFWGTQTPVLH